MGERQEEGHAPNRWNAHTPPFVIGLRGCSRERRSRSISPLVPVSAAIPVVSVGYAGFARNSDLACRLRSAGVERLIDVRALASSRRRGFSKTALAGALAAAGIEYVHMRALGNPRPGRELYRAGRVAEGRASFEDHLREQRAALEELAVAIAQRRCALMCACGDPASCHRSAIIDALRSEPGLTLDVIDVSASLPSSP